MNNAAIRRLNRAAGNARDAAMTIREADHFCKAARTRARAVLKRTARRADRRAGKALLAEEIH